MYRILQLRTLLTLFAPITIGFLLVLGCGRNGKGYKTESGLIFYVYGKHSEDSTARVGSVVKLNIKKYVNDSLVENTYYGIPQYEQVMPGLFYPYEAGEIYPFFHKGDSIVLIQEADTLLKRRLFYPVPAYVSEGDKIVTHIKVLDIFANDSIANADMNEEYPRAIERNRKSGAARVRNYLDEHSIKAELTPDTVFIEKIREGDGPLINPGDIITIRFTAQTISGTVFGTNTREDDVPMDYEVMSGFMPSGIDESLIRLKVGDHARFYIPAMKGFGASPPPSLEKGFQDLIFEVEILKSRDAES